MAVFDASDYPDIAHLLPGSVLALITVIGIDATLMLIDHYGGTTFPVALGKTVTGKATRAVLAEIIGEEAADRLCHAYGAQGKLWVPKCEGLTLELRNRRIRATFDRHTIGGGMTAADSVREIARRYHLTDRHIWRILKEVDQTPPASRQTRIIW